MITVQPYINMPEVIPPQVLNEWRQKVWSKRPRINCPEEVQAFIEVISEHLDDFAKFREYTIMMPGQDLLLCGMKEWNGEKVFSFASYPMQVPVMQAVDHYSTMMRLYQKKGKQGLIDFVKAKVKATELEYTLNALEVNVFHNERPEFKQMMSEIEKAPKIK